MRKLGLMALAWAAIGGAAAAAPVQIYADSYATSGVGYADSTGVELTDGFIPDSHWYTYPYGDPFVGWQNNSPFITFSFDGEQTFGQLIVWADSDRGHAGVVAPLAVSAKINGVTYSSFSVGPPNDAGAHYADPYDWPGAGTPFILNLGGAVGDTIELTVTRNHLGGDWTFLSEVEFFGAVPEPSTWAAMIVGFGMAGAVLRRRRGAPAAV